MIFDLSFLILTTCVNIVVFPALLALHLLVQLQHAGDTKIDFLTSTGYPVHSSTFPISPRHPPDLSMVYMPISTLMNAFLLQANNGNVRLFHGDNAAEQETTPFQLELLTLQNSDNMAGCFAPTASTAGSEPENAPENGATNGAKKGAKNGGSSKAKAKSVGRKGARGGVVGTTEAPSVIQATA